jgi:glycerate-2-kinase
MNVLPRDLLLRMFDATVDSAEPARCVRRTCLRSPRGGYH